MDRFRASASLALTSSLVLDLDGTWRLVKRNRVTRAAAFHEHVVMSLIVWIIEGNRIVFDLSSIR
jgi:hypothetical protein